MKQTRELVYFCEKQIERIVSNYTLSYLENATSMLLHFRVDSHFAVRYNRARARLTKITLSIPIAPGGTVKQMKRFRTRFDLLTSFFAGFYAGMPFVMHLASRSKASLDPYAILLRDSCNALQIIPMKLARIYSWSSREI